MKGIKTRVKNLTLGKRLTAGKLGTQEASPPLPPLRVPQITAGGMLPRVSEAYPTIPALARQWNHQDGSAPLAPFGNQAPDFPYTEKEVFRITLFGVRLNQYLLY